MFLVSVEGIDGSGKTTQLARLRTRLADAGIPATFLREPGGTALGEALRGILSGAAGIEAITPRAELLLFAAARAQLAAEQVVPALERGELVVLDRFTDSTRVYQGIGRALGRDVADAASGIAMGDLVPACTLWLDCSVEVSLARRAHETPDRLERGGAEWLSTLRAGYAAIAEAEPARIVRIDADQDPDQVAEDIWGALSSRVLERMRA